MEQGLKRAPLVFCGRMPRQQSRQEMMLVRKADQVQLRCFGEFGDACPIDMGGDVDLPDTLERR